MSRDNRATNVLVGRDDRGKVFPQASHPVIRTHPVSRRKALFVNQGFTTHIDGLPKEESGAILNYLFEHCTRPEFQVRFRWRPHSVTFWDNRSVQHMALWDYYHQVRSGRRVTKLHAARWLSTSPTIQEPYECQSGGGT